MKKAFTLVEMLIVLLIIWILIWAMSYFSWSYIRKLNVESELETVENTFFSTQVSSLSQPNFGKIKNISYIWVKVEPWKDYLEKIALTWNLSHINPFVIWIWPFSYIKIWTWFEIYSWNNLERTSTKTVYFLYKPYKMWTIFLEDNGWSYNILTGNYKIKFYVNSIYKDKKCFSIQLESWRIKKCK